MDDWLEVPQAHSSTQIKMEVVTRSSDQEIAIPTTTETRQEPSD